MRPLPPARPGEVNHDLFDRFTLVHAAVGATYALLDLGLVVAVLLAVAWELVENPMKATLPAVFPHPTRDTLRNALADMLAVLGGWALAAWALAARAA
jgi:hypothetical protein